MIRVRTAKQPRRRRDDEEPVGPGLLKAILFDMEFRIMALTGYRLGFRYGQPYAYPNKKFVRWVHWDRSLERRSASHTIMQFQWEKN